jgi:hypothetical protein
MSASGVRILTLATGMPTARDEGGKGNAGAAALTARCGEKESYGDGQNRLAEEQGSPGSSVVAVYVRFGVIEVCG